MELPNDVSRAARNVASVADVPWEELPYGPARGLLLEMAYAGLDVSAYVTCDGHWRVRLQTRDMTCAEWAAQFAV